MRQHTLIFLLFAPSLTACASSHSSAAIPWASTNPSCAFPPKDYINDVFRAMTNGSSTLFYSYVADDVSWRVMGSHPLAGHYKDKVHFYNSTSVRLGKIEKPGGTTSLVRVIGGCDEEWSVEEMLGNVTMKNGMPFVNQYSWSTRWNATGFIVEVRAYVDGVLVTRAIGQNEPIVAADFMTERTVIYDGSY